MAEDIDIQSVSWERGTQRGKREDIVREERKTRKTNVMEAKKRVFLGGEGVNRVKWSKDVKTEG